MAIATSTLIGYGVAAAVAAGTTAYSADQNKKAAAETKEAQEEQNRIEGAIQGEQTARARRQQVSQARIAAAEIENTASGSGQQASSAAVVGKQNTTAQAASNIGQINTGVAQQNLLSNARQNVANSGKVSTAGQVAGTIGASAIGSLTSTVANKAGTELANSIFK